MVSDRDDERSGVDGFGVAEMTRQRRAHRRRAVQSAWNARKRTGRKARPIVPRGSDTAMEFIRMLEALR
jgi:hypothetical protein